MLQLSKLFLAFAPLLRENSSVHRGERLSFDPSGLRTWKIRSIRVRSLKAASPAVAYILLTPSRSQLTYIPADVS